MGKMTMESKTDTLLLDALKDAAGTKRTQEEMHAQRVSFIMGAVNKDSGVTKERIEQVLAAE